MKKNDKNDLREKSKEELLKMLEEIRKEFFDQSMDKEQGKLSNTSNLTNLRKKIAVINTIMKQKQEVKNA